MHKTQKRNKASLLAAVTLGLLTLLLICCGGRLPSDFEALQLDQKISAYERYLVDHGSPRREARTSIASHGWVAAERMAQYLTGERAGMPKSEAVAIIYLVQTQHCLLKGSSVEQALGNVLGNEPMKPGEETAVRVTLEAVRTDSTVLKSPRRCS